MRRGDPLVALHAKIARSRASLSWRDGPGWAEEARTAVGRAIGLMDEPWPDPHLTMAEAEHCSGFSRRWVEFPSHQGWNGSGWLLIPDALETPVPAVVCLPGHGAGARSIVGLIPDDYQFDFAIQCVQRGWIALAVEQVSFGLNQSSRDEDRGSSCVSDGMAALLLGESITGWRVRDAMAARRALCTLAEVAKERIGIVGISGGGLTSLWTGAMDPGFAAVGVSGYFTPMTGSILKFDHCPDNFVPGFAKLMDVPDLAGLIAPRWLAVENGTDDHIFDSQSFA